MLNQVIMCGRLTQDPEIRELENNRKVTIITLAVPRSFKNANGEYDTDFIAIKLWEALADNTARYCKKGDLVGVKGRVQTTKNAHGRTVIEIIAEKVTFLSNKKESE